MEAFSRALPPGAMNFVSGSGRTTMPPIMATGDIDGLAFIGGKDAADDLIRQHPHPHRLKVFLQMEAKNMGVSGLVSERISYWNHNLTFLFKKRNDLQIFLPDLFQKGKEAEFENALDEAVLGSLSFNGQRCTALKLFFVPKSHGEFFARALSQRVNSMNVGLPWQRWPNEDGSTTYSNITPLPNQKRINYMKHLIEDAVGKGAKVINPNGGMIFGGPESTLMVPAILYPVTEDMKVYHEEQFGPVIPITTYDSLEPILNYGQNGIYAQQVSIFTSNQDSEGAATLLDRFSSVFGKININSQCGRSPDNLPFSGRRSSAMGVMSVQDALREFSIPTVVAYKDSKTNEAIVKGMEESSRFLLPLA